MLIKKETEYDLALQEKEKAVKIFEQTIDAKNYDYAIARFRDIKSAFGYIELTICYEPFETFVRFQIKHLSEMVALAIVAVEKIGKKPKYLVSFFNEFIRNNNRSIAIMNSILEKEKAKNGKKD